MVELTLVESVIRHVFLYWFLPFGLIILTPFRFLVDFLTMTNPDWFRPWAWTTGAERKEATERHAKKVLDIQEQVMNWNKNGRKGRMCTGRPSWQTFNLKNLNKNGMTKISMDLEDIILIDEESKMLMVEPGVKMGTLTSKILPLGWTIPVLPETESLTVGGCVCGGGIETSSHKYGLFADSCVAYEVILADGTMIKCSKDEYSDIFYSLPCSHGTIGLLTAVYFQVVPASKYVKIEYFPTTSMSEAMELVQNTEHEFVEGIVFGPNQFVIMYGDMVNEADSSKMNSFSKWYSPWFYKHVQTYLTQPKTASRGVEYVPLRDYYHRHQRSLFWEVAVFLPHGNLGLFRYFLGWILPVNVQLMKLITPKYFVEYFSSKNHVLQDIVVSVDRMDQALDFVHKEFQVYPLWLCPVTFSNIPTIVHPSGRKDGKYIDVGIYGLTPKVKEYDLEKTTRRLEKWALENDGIQALYAETFLTKKEFQKMFDLNLYEQVREKYGCVDAFPHVYDKICRAARVC